MFVTNWISTTKIQKISEITNFFRHYFLSRTEVEEWSSANRKSFFIGMKVMFKAFERKFNTAEYRLCLG